MDIADVLYREVSTSERGGELEDMRAKINTLTELLGLVASVLTNEQKAEVARRLGYDEQVQS